MFNEWARRSPLVRILYQGVPIVLAHRLLRTFSIRHLLGRELADLARLPRRSTLSEIPENKKKAKILFVTPRNWRTHALFQASVSQALQMRGADCAMVICGGGVPVCEVAWAEKELFPRCARCAAYLQELAELSGLRCFTIHDHSDDRVGRQNESELERLPFEALLGFTWRSLPLGSYAVTAARWYLRCHDIGRHPHGREGLAGFILTGMIWASGMERVLNDFKPDVIVMLNGLFMEERVTRELAQAKGVRCVFFERGRNAGTVFLSHGQSAPSYDVSRAWAVVRDMPLPDVERMRVRAVIDQRRRGEQLVEAYWKTRESDQQKISQELALPDGAPLAVLFTNVVWDTAMQGRDKIFNCMTDWVHHTIELFRRHPEWMLVVRVHPAESQVPGRESYERVGDWIRQEFSHALDNIRVVSPETPIDSYALMSMAQVGLVYASTAGLELAVEGTPVVVAGEAHYRGKGFTYDPESQNDYDAVVEELMQGRRTIACEQQVELALRYCHLFFLRRMYPMTVLREPQDARPRVAFEDPDELLPKRSRVLDLICDGILTGKEFEMPFSDQ